jgi:hypothetical protein
VRRRQAESFGEFSVPPAAVTDFALDKIRDVLGCTRNEALQIRGALLFQKK